MKNPLLPVALLTLTLWAAQGQDHVIISEFMTSNLTAIDDEDGDPSDWIEFYNPTGNTINLKDHFLTDDHRNLRKWKVPGTLSLPVNGYGLVFASGKDRGGLFSAVFHTNFELSDSGDYLALVAPDGESVISEFASSYPKQRTGISYGIGNNASGGTEERYFETPTPKAPNGPGRIDLPPRVADTKFSVTRGFYDAPITVTITTATEGANIYYSIDGSDPDKGSVFVPGKKYSAPLVIDKTTMLRARAFKDGLEPTNIDTHTYIFVESILTQPDDQPGLPDRWNGQTADYGVDPDIVRDYDDRIRAAFKAIPSLSVVTDQDNLWGSNGLYLNTTTTAPSGSGADFRFEFEVSAELLNPDGSQGFQTQAGLRAQGGASRNPGSSSKHSMSLRFRRDYGAPRLDYPVLKDSPLQSYNSLHLRARYNNSWFHSNAQQRDRALYMRDQWARDSMIAMGTISGGHGDYVHLYLNGLYWGIYVLQERMDSSHYADYYGERADNLDSVNGGAATDGDLTSYRAMQEAARAKDWDEIVKRLDVDNYIDWHIIQRFGSNLDWKNDGNWKAAGGGPDNLRWRFFAWDTERILEGVTDGAPGPSTDPSMIFSSLDDIPQFRRRFADRLHQHLFNGGALTAERNISRLQKRAAQLDLAIIAESARWGDNRRSTPYERDNEWVKERDRLLNDYFPRRTSEVIDQYQDAGLYPSVLGVDPSQYGGRVPTGFQLTLSSKGFSLFNPGKIYYTTDGTDPQASDDSIAATATLYSSSITLDTSFTLKTRARSNTGTWSALTDVFFAVGTEAPTPTSLVLSELMYHPGPPSAEESAAGHVSSDDFEYLELHNNSDQLIDLAGVSVADGVTFDFISGSLALLAPGAHALIVRDPEAFRYRYGNDMVIHGTYQGNLDNDSESILILAEDGSELIDFRYSDGGDWPQTADGVGFSIVLGEGDPNAGSSWHASAELGGSPGSQRTNPSFSILVNEILSNSTAPAVDAIELYNSRNEVVDVSGWFLTDDPNTPKKHALPPGSIVPANGYLVVFEDNDSDPTNNADLPEAFFGRAFGLSSRGDAIYIFSADSTGQLTGYSAGFTFNATEAGITIGRLPSGQYAALASPSLGTQNSAPRIGEVVISEIMYHPDDATPDGEYVELVNRSNNTIALSGWSLSGIGFDFPDGATIAPGEVVLVSEASPDIFRALYAIPDGVTIYGNASGKLNNDGERLTLERPGETYLDNGVEKTTRIAEDSVRYNDASPWPLSADGQGASLHRQSADAYGDDGSAWTANDGTPTPGTAIVTVAPQPTPITYAEWKQANFTADQLSDDTIAGPLADPDNDGFVNRLEYAFATNPTSSDQDEPLSVSQQGTTWQIHYQRRRYLPDSTFTAQISKDLNSWQDAGALISKSTKTPLDALRESVMLTLPTSPERRFLRLSIAE